MQRRRLVGTAVGLGLGGLFLWLALRDTDLAHVAAAVGRAHAGWSVPLMLALAGFCWVKSYRWTILLRPLSNATAAQLMHPVIVGYASTMLLPLQLGELVRTFIASRRLALPVAAVLGSITLERLLDLLSLLLVLGVAGLLGSELPEVLRSASVLVLAAALLALALLTGLALWTEPLVDAAAPLLGAMPKVMAAKLRHLSLAVARGLSAVRRPSTFVTLAGASVLQWALMAFCVWAALAAVGIDIGAVAVLVVLGACVLSMLLPAAPGYVGALQLAFVLSLEPHGVSREDALAASVFYQFFVCVPLLVAGLAYLLVSKRNLAAWQRAAGGQVE